MTPSREGHLSVAVSAHDHVQGPADAPATLVVYGDYECPYTRKALAVVAQLRASLGDQLRFVFRNFPLDEIHPHALQAAQAAEAADAQGQFWPMHTQLFAHQKALEDQDLAQYAALLGLDSARFAHDLETHAYMARIRSDVESGMSSGVQGTPTLFINGRRHDGSWEESALAPALARAIASHSA
ncbi:MAG TPA: thioredoxin domain-containing protein [Chloroflexia bacterium]|nr:thioredoxin domain-containing protein [Chloroflexia bacterium]